MSHTSVHNVWLTMRARCQNEDNASYKNYGGRGIAVCERWESFENFLADMGQPPSSAMSIERKNNNGNYEPGNCIWADATRQANNRRSSKFIEHAGLRLTQAQWERERGLRRGQLHDRLKKGWTVQRAIETARHP